MTITWTTTAPVGIPSSAQAQFSGDENATSTLTLTNVGTNHSGEYACSVRNERGSTGPLQATLTIVGQFSVLHISDLVLYAFSFPFYRNQ